jgi:hypothetical protein
MFVKLHYRALWHMSRNFVKNFSGTLEDKVLMIADGIFPFKSEWPTQVTAQPPPSFGSIGRICMPEMSTCALT